MWSLEYILKNFWSNNYMNTVIISTMCVDNNSNDMLLEVVER